MLNGKLSICILLHILGFEDVSNNANGNLSIQDDVLRFQKGGRSPAQIPVGSIRDLTLGEEDKQVGSVPLAVTKAATPYGGGYVISLFSHKKYDTVTLEYVDSNGGLHGAIFHINKGQGGALRKELEAKGAHVTRLDQESTSRNSKEAENEAR